MLEVELVDGSWTWRWLCAAGRILIYTADTYPTDFEAYEAAKSYRVAFWAMADGIDHRQARCI